MTETNSESNATWNRLRKGLAFVLTAFSAGVLLLLALYPVTSTLRFSNHGELARLIEAFAFVLALAAGFRSVKVGVWLEVRRR